MENKHCLGGFLVFHQVIKQKSEPTFCLLQNPDKFLYARLTNISKRTKEAPFAGLTDNVCTIYQSQSTYEYDVGGLILRNVTLGTKRVTDRRFILSLN